MATAPVTSAAFKAAAEAYKAAKSQGLSADECCAIAKAEYARLKASA